MKKPLAILLLILGGAATITIIALVTGIVFLIFAMMIPASGGWVLYTAAAMFLFLASYPLYFLRDFFRQKYKVNAAVFIICFCAPSLIAAELANLLYTPTVEDTSVIPISTRIIFWLVIAAVFTFWTIVHTCVEAYRIHRNKNA